MLSENVAIGIPTDSRTKHEIFEAWKLTDDAKRRKFEPYWNNQLEDCIGFYEKNDWKLLCLGRNSKTPVAGVKWKEREPLTYDNALTLISAKKPMNLGVNLKKSGLIVADCDDRNIPDSLMPYFFKTTSVISPRGYHLYFRNDIKVSESDETRNALCDSFKKPNLFRGGESLQYTAVPLSCVDGKYYEFINMASPMNISEFIARNVYFAICSGKPWDRSNPDHYLLLDYDENWMPEEWKFVVKAYGLKRALIVESSMGKYWFVSFSRLPVGDVLEIMYWAHDDKKHDQYMFSDGCVAIRLDKKEDDAYPVVVKVIKNKKGTVEYDDEMEGLVVKSIEKGINPYKIGEVDER
jgi:hypothetical protein